MVSLLWLTLWLAGLQVRGAPRSDVPSTRVSNEGVVVSGNEEKGHAPGSPGSECACHADKTTEWAATVLRTMARIFAMAHEPMTTTELSF
jgi:hypothetical protein